MALARLRERGCHHPGEHSLECATFILGMHRSSLAAWTHKPRSTYPTQSSALSSLPLQASASNAVYTPAEAQFLGRNYRQRLLNAQLRDKDLEVKYLRAQLESAIEASKIKDDSIRTAEQVISELREREETAKIGRSKAQLALAAKASALQTCQYQTETLLAEVTMCGKALRRL